MVLHERYMVKPVGPKGQTSGERVKFFHSDGSVIQNEESTPSMGELTNLLGG